MGTPAKDYFKVTHSSDGTSAGSCSTISPVSLLPCGSRSSVSAGAALKMRPNAPSESLYAPPRIRVRSSLNGAAAASAAAASSPKGRPQKRSSSRSSLRVHCNPYQHMQMLVAHKSPTLLVQHT